MARRNVRRVLEEILRGYAHSFTSWSEFLPMAEFAINNSVHASTTHTPFFVNGLRHPRIPALLECDSGSRGEGITRAESALALAHHALTKRSMRQIPMLNQSTSKPKSPITTMLLLTLMMTMLGYSASPMTMTVRSMTLSPKRRLTSPQCELVALLTKP